MSLGGGGSSPSGYSAQNVTTTTSPWAGQSPYLSMGFGGAANLYNGYAPQYYQGTQVAPFNSEQMSALQATENQAMSGEQITGNASNFANNLESGQYLNNNPSSSGYAALANPSTNTNNPAYQYLSAGGNAVNTLQPWANGAALDNPGNNYLQGIASGVNTNAMPGGNTLNAFSSGALANPNNAYSQGAINSVITNTMPQIMSQFAAGGNLSNPASAFAASQGLANAISPLMEQNYEQGLTQMQGAATTQQQAALQGTGLQAQAGQNIASNYLQGANTTVNAGTNATQGLGLLGSVGNSAYGTGLGAQEAGINGLSNNYNTGISQMLSGLSQAPTVQQMPYYDSSQLMNAGNTIQAQQQNGINANMNEWNYNQELPYNILNSFNGSVGGTSWGGSVTQPYYTNNLANIASTLGAGATGLNALSSLSGYGGSAFGSGGLFGTGAGGGLGSLFGGGADAAGGGVLSSGAISALGASGGADAAGAAAAGFSADDLALLALI